MGLLHRPQGAEVEALDYLTQAPGAIYLRLGDQGAGLQAVERALAGRAE